MPLFIDHNCKLELLTWKQINAVLWMPVYGVNSCHYQKQVLICITTWLCRSVVCVSASPDGWAASPPVPWSAWRKAVSWHRLARLPDTVYTYSAVKVPAHCTDGVCPRLNCPQAGSQRCVVPVRIIHQACGLCLTPIKSRPLGAGCGLDELSWSLCAGCWPWDWAVLLKWTQIIWG